MSVKIDPMDRLILEALADNHLSPTAARKAYMHRNTVVYRVNRLKKKTGLNAMDFWDLQKLLDLTRPEQRCNWICKDELAGYCGNPQCPMAGKKCPVPDRHGVCRFEEIGVETDEEER